MTELEDAPKMACPLFFAQICEPQDLQGLL